MGTYRRSCPPVSVLWLTLISVCLLADPTLAAEGLEDPGWMSAWISLPWGPFPDWGLITGTMECRARMDDQLRRQTSTDAYKTLQSKTILIVRMMSDKYAAHAHASPVMEITDLYCKRWNCVQKVYVSPKFDVKYKTELRRANWYKVLTVLSALQNQTEKYDYVMWMDSDAAPTDHSIDIRSLLSVAPEKLYYVSQDIWPTGAFDGFTNAGVFIVKNTAEGIQLMTDWWDFGDKPDVAEFLMNHPADQAVFNKHVYVKYKEQIQRWDSCWVFGHPWTFLDKPFVTHLAAGPDPNKHKMWERHQYFTYWLEVMKRTAPGGKRRSAMTVMHNNTYVMV